MAFPKKRRSTSLFLFFICAILTAAVAGAAPRNPKQDSRAKEKTLEKCLLQVLEIEDESLLLEIIIVDDCSTDNSLNIAQSLAEKYPEITVLCHEQNQSMKYLSSSHSC